MSRKKLKKISQKIEKGKTTVNQARVKCGLSKTDEPLADTRLVKINK